MLGAEVVALVCAIIAIVASGPVGRMDWFRLAVLLFCATVHIQMSRRQEERARSKKPTIHIDLTGIWSFAGVLVLPLPMVLGLIAAIRVQRWFVARRPLHRFLFSSASMVLAAILSSWLLAALGPRHWSNLTAMESLREFGELALAGFLYAFVQAVLVGGGALALGATRTLPRILGTKEDNELEAFTVGIGMVSAFLLMTSPPTVVVMLAIGVAGNRIAEIRQLKVDVRTDPKTGLLNMRGWHEAAERELARASRANSPAALLMIDLDHFKSINDTWGHPAGDDVLESVAHALRSETRPTDIVGRFGGEEFILLLPDANTREAVAAGERIRRRISQLQVMTTDKRGGPISITDRTTSVGIGVYPMHAAALDELLQMADAAVYEAKESGRDQVRLARSGQRARREAPPRPA